MRRPALFWAASLATLGLVDLWCDLQHDDSTLSSVVRATFHTDRPVGRAIFIGAWAGLSAWFVPHICRTIKEA